jgi:hypothetical protein
MKNCAASWKTAQSFVELTLCWTIYLPLELSVLLFVPLGPARRRSAARVVSLIANGRSTPIGMAPFPSVETIEADGVAGNPHASRPEVHTRSAHVADVLDAVPDISVRHADRHLRHGRSYVNHRRLNGYLAAGRHCGDEGGQTNDTAIICFHNLNMADQLCGRYGAIPL